MKLNHPALVELLQRAYSAEKAAAFAYIGHAASLKNPIAKSAVKQIEDDEWDHRRNVLAIMQRYEIPISRWYEIKFHIIGRFISASCHVIGWFMPYFFAGKLESGNVCEYFVMMKYFHALGIRDHDKILYEMGIKEKEHEVYFLEQIKDSKWLPWFEKVFSWGKTTAANDVDLGNKLPVEASSEYCKDFKAHEVEAANRQVKQD
jgi:rubrerythrin